MARKTALSSVPECVARLSAFDTSAQRRLGNSSFMEATPTQIECEKPNQTHETIADMKAVAVILILFGSGLVALGISGFSGELTTDTRPATYDMPNTLDASFDWSVVDRVEMVFGVLSLVGGLLFYKESK